MKVWVEGVLLTVDRLQTHFHISPLTLIMKSMKSNEMFHFVLSVIVGIIFINKYKMSKRVDNTVFFFKNILFF